MNLRKAWRRNSVDADTDCAWMGATSRTLGDPPTPVQKPHIIIEPGGTPNRRHNRSRDMKARSKNHPFAVIIAAFALSAATGGGQVFDYTDIINNRAVAASPRAKEQSPQLTRTPVISTAPCCAPAGAHDERLDTEKNRAYSSSPRVRELFPERIRARPSSREVTNTPEVERNSAIVASPRAREQFPHLLRKPTQNGVPGRDSERTGLPREKR